MTKSTARHYEDLAREVAAGQFSTREVVEALEAAAFNTRANMTAHAKAAATRMPEQRKSNPEREVLALLPKLSFAARARIVREAQR
jgi:hypothetical protein